MCSEDTLDMLRRDCNTLSAPLQLRFLSRTLQKLRRVVPDHTYLVLLFHRWQRPCAIYPLFGDQISSW